MAKILGSGQFLTLNILLILTDLRLHNGRHGKADAVDKQKRSHADPVVQERGDRDHNGRKCFQYAGDGVSLLVISFRDQQWIKALISNHVDALDRSEYKTVDQKEREGKPADKKDYSHQQIQPCGDKIQRINSLLSGEAV